MRLSESPDVIHIRALKAKFGWEEGIPFFVFHGKVVWSVELATHPMMFNTLRVDPNLAYGEEGMWESVTARSAAKEGILSRPKLTDQDIARFEQEWVGDGSALRRKMHAGRAWKNLRHDGAVFSAVSFWTKRAETPRDYITSVINVLGLAGKTDTIYVEFINSLKPEVFTTGGEERRMKSKASPNMSEDDIINILVKAHTHPQALTTMEKKIAAEFRGTPAARALPKGVNSQAQLHAMTRLGDAVQKRKSAKDLLDEMSK